MIVLGIDPGSVAMGYSFLERKSAKIKVLEYGVIRPPKADTWILRLGYITEQLETLFNQYNPDVVSMETIFFAKNARSALILGHARGLVLSAGHRFKANVFEFSPKEVKQAVVGKGGATKEQVAQLMQRHLQLKEIPTPLDASDSLAIAFTYLQRESYLTLQGTKP